MRFVIITLPPRSLCEQIDQFRRPLGEGVGSTEALRYPPHITLRTGLVCPDDQAHQVSEAFLRHAAGYSALDVATAGLFFTSYGSVEEPKGMVGWSIGASAKLRALHEGLLKFQDWQKGPQGEFQPHLSLAYGDLSLDGLAKLRTTLGNTRVPDFAWTLDHVALYYEQKQGWVEWARVALKSSSQP